MVQDSTLKFHNRQLSFLIGGVQFGNQNVGDEAILEGVVNILRKSQPNCVIRVLTDDPKGTRNRLGVKAYKYQFIQPKSGNLNRILRVFSRIGENILQIILAFKSDVIVCAGATILSDAPKIVLRLVLLGIFANKRLIYFPGGMNEGNSHEILCKLREISEEFDLFLVRDKDTKRRLTDAGFNPSLIQVTVDPVFNITFKIGHAIENFSPPWDSGRKDLLTIGLGISNEPDCAQFNDQEKWIKIVEYAIDNLKANIVFLPSNTQPGKDLVIMRKVYNSLKNRDRVYIVENDMSPQDMIGIISTFDIMISSRMHQLIFSTMAETPVIGISRCSKTDSFLALLGLKPVSTVKEFNADSIITNLQDTLLNYQKIKEDLNKRKENILTNSTLTENLVSKCLINIQSNLVPSRPLIKRLKYCIYGFFIRL